MDLPIRLRSRVQGIGTRKAGARPNAETKRTSQRVTERFRAYRRSLSNRILGHSTSSRANDGRVTAAHQEGENIIRLDRVPSRPCPAPIVDELKISRVMLDDARRIKCAPEQMDAQTLRDLTGVGSHLPQTHAVRLEKSGEQRDSFHSFGDSTHNGLPSPRSTYGYPTRTSSCTTTSSRRKHLSFLWARESFMEGSTTDSVFSGRAQSIISTSSIGTVEAVPLVVASTDEGRPFSVKRQRLSSSSSGTLSSLYNEVNLDENPVPSPPSSAGLRNFRSSIDRSDMETLAVIAAQLQPLDSSSPSSTSPSKKTGERPERPVLKIEPVSNWLSIGSMEEAGSAKPLSVISEGNSSFMEASPILPSGGSLDHLPPPSRRTRSRRRSSDSTSEVPTSVASPGRMVSTRATSVDEPSELDETSEGESLVSEDMDETDDPFLEAFAASSLDAALLPFVLSIKDYLVEQVASMITEWVRRHAGNAEEQGARSSAASLSPGGSGRPGTGGQGRKRMLDGEEGGDDSSERDDDEQGKRRRVELDLLDMADRSLFACPFTKRYPGRKWPKCHKKAFKEIHRIKTHMLAPHCERCFAEFESDAEKTAHSRQAVPCAVVEPPTVLVGVTPEVEKRLRSRKGKQNWTEDSKWRAMYTILFDDQTDVPSPYYEFDMAMDPASQDKCMQFIRQQSVYCERDICYQVEEQLHNEPAYNEELRAMILGTIRKAFGTYFVNPMPNTPGTVSKSGETGRPQNTETPDRAISPLELNPGSKNTGSTSRVLSIRGDPLRRVYPAEDQPRNDETSVVSQVPERGSSSVPACPRPVDVAWRPADLDNSIPAQSIEPQGEFSSEMANLFEFPEDETFDILQGDLWFDEANLNPPPDD